MRIIEIRVQLEPFCEGTIRNYNSDCSDAGCSFETEDCSSLNYYDDLKPIVMIAHENNIDLPRIFHVVLKNVLIIRTGLMKEILRK